MFGRLNFDALRAAVGVYSSPIGNTKPGLKQNLYYLLKRSAKTIKAILMSNGKDEESLEIERFTQVLELWEDFIFGDAQYEFNKRRQIKLRRPERLPDEEPLEIMSSSELYP